MADRTLTVKLVGDDRDLKRALDNSERRTRQFGSRMDGLNQSLRGGLSGFGGPSSLLFGSGAFISTAAITAALSASIDAASSLNEEIAKSEQVFQGSAQEILRWSETTADSLGISQRAALEFTGTFGNLLRPLGIAPDLAAEMSRRLVTLAADMASFNNASPEEVLEAIRSGLVGETEPLRRYGIDLREARVQQVALAATGKENVRNLTAQEKAQARFNLILRDTVIQQGDIARTSGSFANQQRILRANIEDLSADVGNLLLPALTSGTVFANSLFDALDRLAQLSDIDIDVVINLKDTGPGIPGIDVGDLQGPIEQVLRTRILGAVPVVGPALAIGDIIRQLRGGEDDARRELESIAPVSERVRDALDGLADQKEAQADAARDAARAARRARREFDAFLTSLSLAEDTARLTATLDDDLAVLNNLIRAIQRRIRIEGRTFELQSLLIQARLDKQALLKDQARAAENAANDAADAQRSAFEATIDALSLRQEVAEATPRLADDLAALRRIEQAIIDQIAVEGRTTDLLRRLFQNRREQAELAAQERQRLQFRQLGLTAEGDERTPTVRQLRRRREVLADRIQGTPLDTDRTRSQLRRISRVLSGEFGKVGEEVRSAIDRMFDTIAEGFDQQSGNLPRTAFRVARTRDLVRGLGLEGADLRTLQQRLSKLGAGGAFIPGGGPGGAAGLPVTGRGGTVIILQGDIRADSPDAFVREVEKRAKRKSGKRSGTRAGGR